ncbi:MAG: MFS transporter [Acidobacteria bacterium]|nr:MFS transporter [Acidobacteriota bacterium]
MGPTVAAASGAAQTIPTGEEQARRSLVALVLLCIGHFFIDTYAGALGALQPRLVAKLGLTLTEAGFLGGALIFASSLCQPLHGYWSDRYGTRMFSVLTPALSGLGICLLGSAPNYASLFACVLVGGAAIAAFHPQASSRVTRGVTASRGTWMAVFISSGTLGFALGPTYFSYAPEWFGLEHLYWAAIPGVLCSVMLWFYLEPEPVDEHRRVSGFELAPLQAAWRPLTILYFCVFIRSIVQVTYAQLLPLYLHRERGMSVGEANLLLSGYLACGAIGGFTGGWLSDRIGGRWVIMLSMIGAVPFLLLFFGLSGWLSMAALLAGGLMLLFTIPVNVVMAQELAPGQSGTVSALMMGFAWGLAGLIFIPLTGWLSDQFGMHASLRALALFPLIGFFLARMLPKETRRRA